MLLESRLQRSRFLQAAGAHPADAGSPELLHVFRMGGLRRRTDGTPGCCGRPGDGDSRRQTTKALVATLDSGQTYRASSDGRDQNDASSTLTARVIALGFPVVPMRLEGRS